jgi:hypothetical protein
MGATRQFHRRLGEQRTRTVTAKGIYAAELRLFGHQGRRLEFHVSGTTSGAAGPAGIASGYYDDVAIVWMGPGIGDSSGVFAQFYPSVNSAPVNAVPGAQGTNEDTKPRLLQR